MRVVDKASAFVRLLRDTPGAVRARIRMQGFRGTMGAIPEMMRLATRHYLQPQASSLERPHSAGEVVDPYLVWQSVNRWTPRRAVDLRQRLAAAASPLPKLSVVMPVYNTPEKWLNKAIQSVFDQVYDNWELCIADDHSPSPHVRPILEQWQKRDPRIKVVFRGENGHISRCTNSAAEVATGEFIALLDHDDELTPDALGEVALALAADPDADLLYSDDDKINEHGQCYMPQFKGDYSPTLLLSYMYFCHLLVVRRRIFADLGGMRAGFEGSQDHDFALRAVEKTRKVVHLPYILYHWRAVHGSTARSGSEKPHSFDAGKRAVAEALNRRGIKGTVDRPDWAKACHLGLYACEFPDEGPSVSIIIPTRNRFELLQRCVESLRKTTYRNYQVVIVDNDSDDPATLAYLKSCGARVLPVTCPGGRFSFAYLNNRAVAECHSDYVLLLNNDTEVIEPRWLSRMMGHARQDAVGSVGGRLLFPDGRVQHAGIVNGLHGGLAGHAFKLAPDWSPGYMNLARTSREVAAVTAACLLTPRELYLRMGGLDEQRFNVAYNDVDYGYRLHKAGYRNVFCADADLRHYEGATRGFKDNPAEVAAFRAAHGSFVDPFCNPSLSLEDEQFNVLPRRVQRGERKLKRVLYATHAMTITGGPLIQHELALQLRQRHGVEIVAFSPEDGPLAERYRAAGVEPIIGPDVLREVFTGRRDYVDAVDALATMLRQHEIDAVYANTFLTFYMLWAAEKAGVGAIWNIHESEYEYYLRELGSHLSHQAIDYLRLPYRVIFGSRATMERYKRFQVAQNFTCQHNSICSDRCATWRQLPREQIRRDLGIAHHEIALLTVGTICDRKGQADLAHAFAALPERIRQRVRCWLVGDVPSPYSQRLTDFVNGWPADLRQRFSIVRETDDVGRYYRAADVFVCSSRVECFPRVNLEAMHMGLPLITTPVFGVPEQVWDGVNGIYYSPGDVPSLVRGIEKLITDAELRRKMACSSFEMTHVLPNDMEVADRYYNLLHEAYLSRM